MSNMAHELKTPLAIVKSHAEGLREHIAEERRDEYLEAIVQETERMDGMILRMLELSRLEAGRVKLVRETFSLKELVEETIKRLEPAYKDKGLEIEMDLAEAQVNADRDRIGEVIENLISNAFKYTAQGGKVRVRVGREGAFSVYNEAAPFSQEAKKRIWEPFYRESASRTDRGTGLGLAIAKEIVELHGGEIWVRNVPSGVEFGFRI